MPVSSGWIEDDPVCFREESGRFLLAFRSDREGQHQKRIYLSWSRDLESWSRPAMVVDRSVGEFDIIRNRTGQLIWADATAGKIRVLRSQGGYHWESLGALAMERDARDIALLQREDGAYELFSVGAVYRTSRRQWGPLEMVIRRYSSRNGITWSPPEEVARFENTREISISAMQVRERLYLGIFRSRYIKGGAPDMSLHMNNEGGKWVACDDTAGLASVFATMRHHPRWGFMIAWHQLPDTWRLWPSAGPYLIRGKSISQFFVQEKK